MRNPPPQHPAPAHKLHPDTVPPPPRVSLSFGSAEPLPKLHPRHHLLLSLYVGLARTAARLGDPRTALCCALETLSCVEAVLPGNHHEVAQHHITCYEYTRAVLAAARLPPKTKARLRAEAQRHRASALAILAVCVGTAHPSYQQLDKARS